MFLPLTTALSLADPITDILTLMEFYNAGHKIWFSVGLIFLILPCFGLSAAFCSRTSQESTTRYIFDSACLCGFHPFSTAVQKLQAFIVCSWKIVWHGETIVEDSYEFEVLKASKVSAFFEAVFEAALYRECSTGSDEHHSNDFFTSFICKLGLVFSSCG